VKYIDPDGEQSNDSIFGFSFNPWEDYINFWGSIIGNISAFFGNKTAQNNINAKVQYYLQELDKINVATLTEISDASLGATIFFIVIGHPEVAAVTSTGGLVAEGMLIVHDWVSAFYANDQAGMKKAVNNGTFLVAGLIIGNQTVKAVNKALSITADGKTIIVTGNKWEDYQRIIRNEFGNLTGSVVEGILSAAKKAYDE